MQLCERNPEIPVSLKPKTGLIPIKDLHTPLRISGLDWLYCTLYNLAMA